MKNFKTIIALSGLLFLASCSNNTDAGNNNQLPVTTENSNDSIGQENSGSGDLNPNVNRGKTPPDFGSGSQTPPDFGSGSGMPPGGFGSGERMGPPNGSGAKMMNGSGSMQRPPRGEGKRGGYGSGSTTTDSTTKAS